MECYIIGNGVSRSRFILENLEFPTFGCNALYREYLPDYLIAIDSGMINEIKENRDASLRLIDIPYDDQFEPAEFNPYRPRENSGMICMREAIQRGFKHLYCIGFDFLVEDVNLKMGNIFEGSRNYENNTKASLIDIHNRRKYFHWFARKNPEITFTFLYPEVVIVKYMANNVIYGVVNDDRFIKTCR